MMTVAGIIKHLAYSTGFPRLQQKRARRVLFTFFEQLNSLPVGESIRFHGFGTFTKKRRTSKTMRSNLPLPGSVFHVAEYEVLTFRAHPKARKKAGKK